MDPNNIVEIGGKLVLKVGLNMVCPGSGSVVDIAEAIKEFANGNYVGGTLSLISAGVDVATLGGYGAVKDSAKGVGREVMKNVARQEAKKCTKELGKEAAEQVLKKIEKDLARELSKNTLETIAENSLKEATKKSVIRIGTQAALESGGKNIGGKVTKAYLGHVVRGMTKTGAKEVTKNIYTEAAERAMKPMIAGTVSQMAQWDVTMSVVKGAVKCSQKD